MLVGFLQQLGSMLIAVQKHCCRVLKSNLYQVFEKLMHSKMRTENVSPGLPCTRRRASEQIKKNPNVSVSFVYLAAAELAKPTVVYSHFNCNAGKSCGFFCLFLGLIGL